MSTCLTCIVAHVRVKAGGGGGGVYLRDHTSCTVCMHMHAFFGVKHTVLIPVKRIHPSAINDAWVLNNAQS